MKYANKLMLCVLCLALLVALSVPALAVDHTIDWTKNGSLTVIIEDSEDPEMAPVVGASIAVYHVASAKSSNGQFAFTYTKDFAGCGLSLDDIGDEALAQQLADYATEKRLSHKTELTDELGMARFDDLTLGLYLVIQEAGAEYSTCLPFLVTIPGSDSNMWLYNVYAQPKTGIIRLTNLTVKKVWENDKTSDRPTSIDVKLLKNGEVAETVTLTAAEGWTHTWIGLSARENWTVEEEVPENYEATYKQEENVITITNASTLIQTGQLNWPIPVFAGLGLLLFAAGWVLIRKKKSND